jgi:hypothetical protein
MRLQPFLITSILAVGLVVPATAQQSNSKPRTAICPCGACNGGPSSLIGQCRPPCGVPNKAPPEARKCIFTCVRGKLAAQHQGHCAQAGCPNGRPRIAPRRSVWQRPPRLHHWCTKDEPLKPEASAGWSLDAVNLTRWCFCFRRQTHLAVAVVITEGDPERSFTLRRAILVTTLSVTCLHAISCFSSIRGTSRACRTRPPPSALRGVARESIRAARFAHLLELPFLLRNVTPTLTHAGAPSS